ncbi:hypothetical protein [Kineococcus gypseus]|uniref:hypothetical protein n=1 Tax=Kineococcus gypseus TaxID=1637102 RepID=UPI003D7CF10E
MTPIVLAASLLLAGPSIVSALRGTGSVDTALLHLALALLVSAVAGRVVRTLVVRYQAEAELAEVADGEPDGPRGPGRRRDDA